jgi:phosphoglycerate dehydrogenase-like enzyme
MTTILLSKAFQAEFGQQLHDTCAKNALKLDIIDIPEGGAPPLSDADLARIECFFLSRDVRFSKELWPYAQQLVPTIPNIKWLHFASSGASQHKWLASKLEQGLTVTTSVGNNAEPVAQTALLGLLMLARPAMLWVKSRPKREWVQRTGKDVPPDIAGQTIVIVGLGSIGRHLARMVLALRMNVIGIRRSPRTAEDPEGVDIQPPSRLMELVPQADWIVFCLPATSETRGLLSKEMLGRMKRTAYVINVARGDVIDEEALIEALRTNRIAGAHLDVFNEEPLPPSSPLWDLPNLFLTPHNASVSQGNNRRANEIFLDNFVHFARGEPLKNVLPR